jgi:outer membrane lipoprotein-sorting protein
MHRLIAVLLSGVSLAAALTGSEILDRVRAVTSAKDRRATATMTITDKSKRVQSRTMKMVMKGDSKLMMTFEQPADLRGVTFMSTSAENMWIYLPAQGRVRRISGSSADQGFGGSDFSYREMANLSFAEENKVQTVEETEHGSEAAWLLTMKDGAGARSRFWVEQARFLPLRVEKLAADGKAAKRIDFSGYENEGESWIPGHIEMQDLSRGSRTELKLDELDMNTGVKDNFFTEANMKKGA